MDNLQTTIIDTAREMAGAEGLINLTKRTLCERVGIPEGSFQHAMGGSTFSDLLDVLREEGAPHDYHAVRRGRADPKLRKAQILAAAIDLAIDKGYRDITRLQVAVAAGVSPTLVTRYFETMDALRDAIMGTASRFSLPKILAQGLAVGDPIALAASDELKQQVADYINNL